MTHEPFACRNPEAAWIAEQAELAAGPNVARMAQLDAAYRNGAITWDETVAGIRTASMAELQRKRLAVR